MSRDRGSNQRTRRYAKLEPTVRRVSRAAIQKKWKKLPEPTQGRLRAEFRSLQKPSLDERGKGKKDAGSQEAVDMVLKLLEKRLPRMPFPPSTLDSDFDFEATIDRKRSLDSELTKMAHSISLLEGEITREQDKLLREETELETLQKDLKTNDVLRRRRAKKVHPLATTFAQTASKISDSTDKIYCATSTIDPSRSSSNNPSVAPLVAQLNDHLHSMQNNSKITAGVKDAICHSQAALDAFIDSTLAN